jgi:hypothetical protein
MYVALNYMKYNAAEWYAAVLAGVFLVVIFSIFLNVIQFEVYNNTGVCHPYFYQSSACRKLIANSIASDPNFQSMKQTFSSATYDKDASLTHQVNAISNQVSAPDSTTVSQISQIADAIQNLGSYLGSLQQVVAAPAPGPAASSTLSQLKSLVDSTLIDPAMAKYVEPLQRLYRSMSTAPGPAPA